VSELPESLPSLWKLFQELRRRKFRLGPDDYEAVRQALRVGFGWSSREALCELCCALWAKSRQEQDILIALFDKLELPEWVLFADSVLDTEEAQVVPLETPGSQEAQSLLTIEARSSLPPISLSDVQHSKRHFLLAPQFPLNYREIAQVWRHLRRPIRQGSLLEIDVEATVARRCRMGIPSSVVLIPRRRNTTRLFLLVDRRGSMTPFHRFCDEVCKAIQQAGKLEQVALYFFQNLPAEGADESVLELVADQPFPTMDKILSLISPLQTGDIYKPDDPKLIVPLPLEKALQQYASGASVVILSDAGAARGHYNTERLLNTVAFLKALRSYTLQYVWLNPLPKSYRYWKNSTAEQIARHIPMFSLDRDGMYQAVNVLRGHPCTVERPI
jgi:uncharacterized protein with von Willebrand factor type A (vWA) domain